jgi:hypothetical protein
MGWMIIEQIRGRSKNLGKNTPVTFGKDYFVGAEKDNFSISR